MMLVAVRISFFLILLTWAALDIVLRDGHLAFATTDPSEARGWLQKTSSQRMCVIKIFDGTAFFQVGG